MPEMIVTNLRKVGQYFIKMALGTEEIPTGQAEIKELLKQNGVDVSQYGHIHLHLEEGDDLHLIVRSKESIQKGQEVVDDVTVEYMIHDDADEVYREFYLNPPTANNVDRKQELYDIRVGDYTLGTCM